MKTEDLKISVEDKVATFTFNRPDKFNTTVPNQYSCFLAFIHP